MVRRRTLVLPTASVALAALATTCTLDPVQSEAIADLGGEAPGVPCDTLSQAVESATSLGLLDSGGSLTGSC